MEICFKIFHLINAAGIVVVSSWNVNFWALSGFEAWTIIGEDAGDGDGGDGDGGGDDDDGDGNGDGDDDGVDGSVGVTVLTFDDALTAPSVSTFNICIVRILPPPSDWFK